MSESLPVPPYEQGLRQALEDGLPDRYALARGEPLGRGGFGIVYEAYDSVAAEPVAVKILNAPDYPEMKADFRDEAHRLHALHHPHIIGVKWTGSINNRYRDSLDCGC